ncbi:amidase family protein [Candidatus Marinimicrobia bacterium]|nr:amidase family protein [Candidatus Neomarinimicrobiota bacterium]
MKKTLIILILLIIYGCNHSLELSSQDIEEKYNIYISKLSNEQIQENLNRGLKPIAIKDNIDVKGFANTAGSLALKDNLPSNNAFLIQQLVDKGYFVIGKTNLSEWANFRSSSSTSGWSSMGGQTINPYGSMRTPCGSSSGSGVVVATGLIDVAIGTETNGSVSCPASVNGIVGIKPTVGLVSRSGIIPISHTQDTAGPMASSVEKAAEILEIIAGKDIHDPATLNIPEDFNFDFTSDLNKESLKGKRFGLLPTGSNDKDGEKALQKIRELLENAGAIVMDIEDKREYPGEAELLVLMYEFKENLEKYLANSNSPHKTLSDLIKFNDTNKEKVLKYFDQSIFVDSDKTSSQREEYLIALDQIINTRNGIDNLLEENDVDALVGLSWSPAWAINHDGGDDEAIAAYRFWVNGSYAAMAGYPHVTVPLDYIDGLPIGMSFIGTAWSDKQLIEYAHSFEQLNNFNPIPTL